MHKFYRFTFSCTVAFFTLSSVLQAQNPNPNQALNDTIQDIMFNQFMPGAATVIVKDNAVVWMESFGQADIANNIPVTDSTAFLLASVSKLFTITAAMQLYDQGYFNLDEDINHHLNTPLEVPFYEHDSITFRNIMTHTASIVDEPTDKYYSNGDPNMSLQAFIRAYLDTSGSDFDYFNFYDQAPGDSFAYSNVGSALMGYMVEKISGKKFDAYSRNNVFNNLCMRNTSWFLQYMDTSRVARPYRYNFSTQSFEPYAHYSFADYPSGLLRSSIQDLSQFLLTYLNDGVLGNDTLLHPLTVQEMLTPQIPGLQANQGLIWYVDTVRLSNGTAIPVWGHNGGEKGVSADMYINQKDNMGVAVITNGDGADNRPIINALYEYGLNLNNPFQRFSPCNTLSQPQTPRLAPHSIQAYPNPSRGSFLLKSNTPLRSLSIYNNTGALLQEQKWGSPRQQITLSIKESGLYFIKTTAVKGNISRTTIVVQ